MAEPTLALKLRLEDILRRRPVPAGPTIDAADALRDAFLTRATELCDQRFPARYTNARITDPTVTAWAHDYHQHPRRAKSLLLLGPTGVGKTHHAYAALRAAAQQPKPLRWDAVTAADLYATLRPRTGIDTEAELARYRNVDLLCIDDLGAAKPTEWTEEITYRILNARYNHCLPVILTSNLALADFKNRLGDRITSRLAEMCTRVILTGGDRRRQ